MKLNFQGSAKFLSICKVKFDWHIECSGVGAAFIITNSKVKQHVMPDFSKTPLNTDDDVNHWLKFYDMNPPLVAVGTFVTNDPVWKLM
jgi:hypothetical protein